LSGTITVVINGQTFTSGTINLSSATSYSNAALLIQNALNAKDAAFTGAISGSTLTVSAVSAGALAIGQVITGAGVTAGTTITGLGTGTGGTGTYTVSPSQSVSSTAMTAGAVAVTYDSVSGGLVITDGTPGAASLVGFASGPLAASLFLTSATGAVQSPGAAAGVPATNMAAVIAQTQDFATFTTLWEPSTADKIAFAAWVNGTIDRYLYVMWDSDVTVTTSSNVNSAGYAVATQNYAGTAPLYVSTSDPSKAAFLMGAIASIDFTEFNGRATMAFKTQSGLAPDVTNQSIGAQLIANGYNFFGAWATANDRFLFLYPGSESSNFLWIDSYINQIWMNNAFQLSLMTLLTNVKSIPYNAQGYALIEAALLDVIQQALDFGALRAGVDLSPLQEAEVNAAAGFPIAQTLEQRGWYVQVRSATAQTRAARSSPPVTFWYVDGQAVQKINLASVQIQ